jgi:hypothetical protein
MRRARRLGTSGPQGQHNALPNMLDAESDQLSVTDHQ